MTAPLICKCCEAPSDAVSDTGLCGICASHDVLARAFAEGLERLAETARRAGGEPEGAAC